MTDYNEVQNYLELAQNSSDQWFKDRALMRAADEINTLRQKLEQADARAIDAVNAESELCGPMPDGMWDALREAIAMDDRDTVEELLRMTVRSTKRGIIGRLRQQADEIERGTP